MKDELIQHQIEKGDVPAGWEGRAYRIVFNALKRKPDFKLPSDFAHRVAGMAPVRANVFNWDKFFLILGSAGSLVLLLYAILLFRPTLSVGVFRFFSSYAGLAFFGIGFILLLNWLDQKLIRKIHL
ncbi:MAG: hypothetical protein JST69_00970 [Bacteroidetes bacterium]|nr:hypothetical protein [Bacteroidota bacterium]